MSESRVIWIPKFGPPITTDRFWLEADQQMSPHRSGPDLREGKNLKRMRLGSRRVHGCLLPAAERRPKLLLGYCEDARGIGGQYLGKTEPIKQYMVCDEPLCLAPASGGKINIQTVG